MQVAEQPTKPVSVEADLLGTIQRFARWLEKSGYESFDPYDVWGTKYGAWSRKVYYKRGAVAVPLIAPILLLEMVCPSLRRLFVRKERFATADGQLVLAMMNLHAVSREESWLKKAAALADEVLGYSVPGYRGYCWGYPFDWQNVRTFWPKNTPYITSTPYCFEAFLALHDVTGEKRYLDVAASIAEFVAHDLRETPTGDGAAAGSYSPLDNSKVINATAYRSMVLFEAAARFGNEEYRAMAERNLQFVLQSQREDGAWLYSLDGKGGAFIDHFHTCFVLKNLFKLNERRDSSAVRESIRKGYAYYRQNLFDAKDNPRSFAVEPRFQIVQLEMYNFAEAITLGALLKEEIPEAFELACKLAQRLGSEHQLPGGYFVTRVFRGGLRHKFPFLRWPQAQLFYALTNLLRAIDGDRVRN